MNFTAADYEQEAEVFRNEWGDAHLAELALKRAKELRAQGDKSCPRAPNRFTLSEIAEAANDFKKKGKYYLTAQAREVVAQCTARAEAGERLPKLITLG